MARNLLEDDVDMAYAYKPLNEAGLGHTLANTLLFLDLERQGFNYPEVPVAIYFYGSNIILICGGANAHSDEPDPPSPSPRRCFEVGQATARII